MSARRLPGGRADTIGWEPVIGLEVHVQLATRTRLFSAGGGAAGGSPNRRVDPEALGLPGTLPTLNRVAVELAVTAGLALGCTVHPVSRFARKNYFYPDLPKGYQLTQYDAPLCTGGAVGYALDGVAARCGLLRVHLEEDTARTVVGDDGRTLLLDHDRAGLPLVEVVGAAELHSPAAAHAYLRALHELLVFAGVTEGNLEVGQFRCDANVSLRAAGSLTPGPRTELKNLNSFRFVEAALGAELARQREVLDGGGAVAQQTMAWDREAGCTRLLRHKEQADDYRYFDEPDLPPLVLEPGLVEALRARLPESPTARRARYVEVLGLPSYDADVLTRSRALADLFDGLVEGGAAPKAASNFVMTEVLRVAEDPRRVGELRCSPESLAALLAQVEARRLTRRAAASAFEVMARTGEAADDVVARLGLSMVDDAEEVAAAVRCVLAGHPEEVARYREGAGQLLGFFMGQVMTALRGRGDAAAVRAVLEAALADA